MKAKMNRLIFTRGLHDPRPQDHTEYEISLNQVKMMCAAYARANTKGAAGRKLSLKSLWRAAGRAGEPAFLSYEGFRWNTTFDTITTESPQSKPSKLKYFSRVKLPPPHPLSVTHPLAAWLLRLVIFVAGDCAHSDWIIDLADLLVLDRGGTEYNSEVKTPLLPELQSGVAATKCTGYIKAVQVTPCPCS